jgi:apolipoprotein D and lipocalin family protein
MPPLEAMDRKVDLERFMGDWYVIGFIPVTIPFFSEEGAHNGLESYRLTDEGVIETTYTFRKGSCTWMRTTSEPSLASPTGSMSGSCHETRS